MELILDFYHIYELSNSQLNLTLQKTSKIGRLAPIGQDIMKLTGTAHKL